MKPCSARWALRQASTGSYFIPTRRSPTKHKQRMQKYILPHSARRDVCMVTPIRLAFQAELIVRLVLIRSYRPKAILKVWRFNDSSSTNDLLAYGVTHFPKTSGFSEIECQTWTPYGDWKFGALSFYLDSTPRLNNLTIMSRDLEKRKKIFSQPAGKVLLEVETIRKNFSVLNLSSWF